MHNLHQKLLNCIDRIDLICNRIYAQQYIHAINNIELFMNWMQEVSEGLLSDSIFAIDETYYLQVLSGIMEAQQQEDYVLFADLLQLQLRPLLLQCQAIIMEQNHLGETEDYFEQNCKLLKEQSENGSAGMLLQVLSDWKNLRSKSSYQDVRLQIEPTSVGAPTVLVQGSKCSRYFHSNENPYMAARRFAANIKDAKEYAIFGFGLGYHIEQLAIRQSDAVLTVYEPDIGMLANALIYRDMAWMLCYPKIQIIYDPDYVGFLDKIGQPDVEVVLHYPSLSMIPNESIKSQFEGIKVRLENIALYDKQFKKNMESNFHNIKQSAERIKQNFENKQVVIVAGGPSLDKNVHYLKECNRSNTILFATGAVLRKLLQMDIVPDYAIITDPKQYTVRQITGLENCGVPLLLMATAIGEISATYKGELYLVCQEGVKEAEEFAKDNDYQLFRTGGSVATAALDVAIRFGAKSIVFIGLDLAFTGNKTHASDLVNETMDSNMEYIQVSDWNGENISTSKPFSMYLQWIEKRMKEKDVTMKIYDATEGGARKEGMIPVRLADILSKQDL